MIGLAHTSRLYWGYIGSEVNFQRGEWLLARIYALLNRPEASLYHAKECGEWTEKANLKGFDLAYSYKGLARPYACNKNRKKAQVHFKKALEASKSIEREDDREYFLKDMKAEPWFGIEIEK